MKKNKPIKNPNTTSTDKSKHELSAIEKRLLECARKDKSVFLYGKSSIDRKAMVRTISKEKYKKHKFINCQKMDGEKVFKKLTDPLNGVLFKHTGSLFANNLHCDPNRKKDLNYYNKLADIIEEFDISVKWLVVYASKRKNFPPYFKRQFKMISLKSEVEKTIEIDRDRKLLIYKKKEEKLELKQIDLFELLLENKDEAVRREEIYKKLWAGYDKTHDHKYPNKAQIDQHVSKLRKGLRKLGFKREIISTIKSKQSDENGGYIFNSNLNSFLK